MCTLSLSKNEKNLTFESDWMVATYLMSDEVEIRMRLNHSMSGYIWIAEMKKMNFTIFSYIVSNCKEFRASDFQKNKKKE